ncbi:MAG: hypothetical protein WC544_02760 [Patescibacteria group bacterium]
MSTRNALRIVGELHPSSGKSHSNDPTDMTIEGESAKLGIVHTLDKADKRSANFQALVDAGWDGKRCIGPIPFTEALTRIRDKKPLACRKNIPKARREALPNAYRCAACQGKKETQGRDRNRR